MSVDIDFVVVILMESFAALAFVEALLFFWQHRRISSRQRLFQEALEHNELSNREDGKCHSFEWVMDNVSYKPRKLLDATPFLAWLITVVLAILYHLILPRILYYIISFGYVIVVGLLGIGILLWTDAFQAISYTNWLHKIRITQLDKEDETYIKLAQESLQKTFTGFIFLGAAFALLGPFTTQIFDDLVNVLTSYASFLLQIAGQSTKISPILGLIIALGLPAAFVVLPMILGVILISRLKWLFNKLFKSRVGQHAS